MPSVIIAPENATATAQNMIDNRSLFQLGIIADIAVLLMEVILTTILYQLFKPVNKTISMVAAFSRLAMSIIMGINLLNYIIPLQLLNGADYLLVFQADQLEALALAFLNAHQYVVYVWGLFFGLHLLALGYLIFKSAYVPRVMGTMMMIGAFGYSIEGLVNIALLDNKLISMIVVGLLVVAVVGELSFTFWLLIKGVKTTQ